jgi:hypothetical protein
MINNKYIFLILGMILLISFTSAQKIYTDYDLIVSSNNATNCNFSYIKYPNTTVTFYHLEMAKSGNDFSIQIKANNFSEVGDVCMGVSCTDGSSIEVGSVCEKVTPTGFIQSMSYYLLILIFSLGLIILGLALKDAPITILGSLGLYFLGIYILFYGLVDIRDPIYTWGTGLIILGTAFYISLRSAYELISD